MERKVQCDDVGPPEGGGHSPQLILRNVKVLQHVELVEKVLIDNCNETSPEYEVLEVGPHPGEVVVGISEDSEDVSSKVESLNSCAYCHVYPNRHQIEIVVAETKTSELGTGNTAEGETYWCPIQTWL